MPRNAVSKFKGVCIRFACFLLLLFAASITSVAGALTHRYSFTTNANDSIGTANGTLGSNAVITNGSLVLSGSGSGLTMPANLFTNSSSLSIECWFINNKVVSGQFLWVFGGTPPILFYLLNNVSPPNVSSGDYATLPAPTNASVTTAQIPAGNPLHLVWSQDSATHTARIFLNGHLYGINTNFTATPGTTVASSALRSPGGAGANGQMIFTEFRIYSNALSHVEVLQSKALGPDALPANGDTITNLQLRVPSFIGLGSLMRPRVAANFTGQSNVDITPLQEIVFICNETNVIATTADDYVSAVGLGTTDLIASYGGYSATSSVTVVAPEQFALVHRYDFHGTPGSTNLPDLAGNAPGILVGGAAFTNATAMRLNGANGYVDLPDGILSSLSEVTLEAWVTGYALNGKMWPRLFDFGSGLTYFYLAPSVQFDVFSPKTQLIRFAATTNGKVGESPRLTAQPWMVDGFDTYLAVTYSPVRNESKLYINGVLADSGPAPYPLNSIVDTNNWLGRSEFPADDYFNGVFDEFRIYSTVLEPNEIAASYALGPDVIGADFVLKPRAAETNLVISWGPSSSWMALQSATALTPGTIWTNAPLSPVFTNGHFEVNIPMSEEFQFFQLSTP